MKKIYIIALICFCCLNANNFIHAQIPTIIEDVEVVPTKIALVIPFCTKYEPKELAKKKLIPVQEAAIEYYQGLRMAIDSLRMLGFQFKLNVYDTNKDSLTTLEIFKKSEMKEMDLIIGPFFKEGIEMAAKYCKKNKVYHIAPTTNVSLKDTSPYLISPNTELINYTEGLTKYIMSVDTPNYIYVLTDGKKQSQNFARKMKMLGDSLHLMVKVIDASKEITTSDLYHSEHKVSLVFPTNNNAMAQKLFKSITDTGAGITIVGLDSWLDFKSNNYQQWEKYHVTILTDSYIDYSDPDVNSFVKKYHTQYSAEPTIYSFKGFDQLMSIASGWLSNPNDWKEHIDQWGNPNGLASNILYIRDFNTKGIINKNIRILKFENYQLKWVW